MTRHLLVGYLATSTGRDALHLGIALAREQDAHLHVVMIAQQDSAYAGIYPPAGGYGLSYPGRSTLRREGAGGAATL